MSRRNPDYSDEEEARGKAGAAILERYADTIREGMAEALWTLAYAEWADENRDEADEQLGRAKAGQDWADNALSNGTPAAAGKAAADLYKLYETANGNMVTLFSLAEEADMDEPFSFYEDEGDSKRRRLDQQWKLSDAHEFGQGFAAMALGHGIGWFDDHKEFTYEKVRFECHYDGADLTWSGGTSDVREANQRIGRIVVVNDTSFYHRRYLLGVRAGAEPVILLIGADGMDSALDEMIDWITENENQLIITAQVHEQWREAMLEAGLDPLDNEDAESDQGQRLREESEADTTTGGNASDYINSDSWFIVAENPTDEEIQKVAYARNPDQFSVPSVTNPAPKKGAELREPWTDSGVRGVTVVVKHDQHGISAWLEASNGSRIPISFGSDHPTTLRDAMASAKRFLRRAQGPGGGMVNPARAREMASRIVRNCGCKQNPTMAELKNPKLVQAILQEGLHDEFAQKVAAITLKPGPMGREKTMAEFERDLAANLAMGLMVEDDE